MRKHPHLNPIFPATFSISNRNTPATIHSQQTITFNIQHTRSIILYLSIELMPKETPTKSPTSLHSQEQSISRTFRFNLFEFNFFNLNIGIGFFEQLHPDGRIPINTPDFILVIVFNVTLIYYS